MAARLSVEELRPASERRRARARVRRRFQGARVLDGGMRLEPRDAGGILDLALAGLLARFGPCIGVALLLWIPFRQISELVESSGGDGSGSIGAMLVALAWRAFELVPLGITASVTVRLVADALEDRRTPAQESIRRGLVRAPGVIVLILVTQIALLPLVLMLVVPFVLAQWLTWAALPIYVLEGDALLTADERVRGRRNPLAWMANGVRRFARALVRSFRLSLGWPAFGRWLLVAIVAQLLLASLGELGVFVATYPPAREVLRDVLGLDGATAEFALGAVAAALTALSACLRGAFVAAYYLDLRVRREGWDLELRLRGERDEGLVPR